MNLQFRQRWNVGFNRLKDEAPVETVPAEVPGAVQLDWARAKGWGPYTYGDNWKDYGWMEDVYWTYSTALDFQSFGENERLYFVCKGIDYEFSVRLNDEVIHTQEGMFTPFEIDLTEKASLGDMLYIQVYPAPKREDAGVGRAQADQCCKPAVSYGWDWHPRLIPLGIWEETYLEIRNVVNINSAEVRYRLSDSMEEAEITLDLKLCCGKGRKLEWILFDVEGVKVFEREETADSDEVRLYSRILNPRLWWPNGEGEAYLYKSAVRLYDEVGNLADEVLKTVGFKRVRLIMHPGAWSYPQDFPKSRSNPPITMEINGRSIFCKGTNWVNPEIFPGIISRDTYRPLLELARDAHMNLLRSWGGGIINKESFFQLCDEMGLMVWQEFPLACNNYEETAHYLQILDQESKSIIARLRQHPSVVLWCGGNELFNAWSGMTEQSLALRLLNRNCYDLDPYTPFIMTSPLMGMAHGNYLFCYHDGREVFQAMVEASNTAYTEFGCPGPSSAEYLKTFIPEEELFPPRPGTVWESHHAFNAWVGNTWLTPDVIESYFGKFETLEEMVEYGQILQSEGYKCIYEEARRQKPKCSMALNWCYNEPWPTAANNSLVNWPAEPKPAYYAVKNSCRPVLASARIQKFSWKEGEVFNPELWMLNDSPEKIEAGHMDVVLIIDGNEIELLSWDFQGVKANTNLPGPIIRFILPCAEAKIIKLVLRVKNRSEYNSEYTFVYGRKNGAVERKTRQLNM